MSTLPSVPRPPSRRRLSGACLAALAALLGPALGPQAARAEEAPAAPPAPEEGAPPPAAQAPPEAVAVASDAEAQEALAAFEEQFKAKGTKGDERVAARLYALKALGRVQHPLVVERLFKETRNRDADVRTEALLQLGRQSALPATAGRRVIEALEKHKGDETFVMAALECIGSLGYLGAGETLRALMKHKDYSVMKHALDTIGELKDVRLIDVVWQLLKDLKIDAGASWDGVEVNYDTGAAGDHDQKMAEKIGKEKEAANAGKGRSSGRRMRDLGPVALQVMKALTGEEFSGSIAAREWMDKNQALLEAQQKALAERERTQP